MNLQHADILTRLILNRQYSFISMFHMSYSIFQNRILKTEQPTTDDCLSSFVEKNKNQTLCKFMSDKFLNNEFNIELSFNTDNDVLDFLKSIYEFRSFAFKRFFVDCDDSLNLDEIFKLSQSRFFESNQNQFNYQPIDFIDYESFIKQTGFNEERLYFFMQKNKQWFKDTNTDKSVRFTMFEGTEFELTLSLEEWQNHLYQHSYDGKKLKHIHYLMSNLYDLCMADVATVNDIFYMKQNNEPAINIWRKGSKNSEEITLAYAEERLKFIRDIKTRYSEHFFD